MRKFILIAMCLLCSVVLMGKRVEAASLYENPHVSFSPDGTAFTTEAGETDYTWYQEDYTVYTGVTSILEEPEIGQHDYFPPRNGNIPIAYWKVHFTPAKCIHGGYPDEEVWHGIEYGQSNCHLPYNSGWYGVCADCEKEIEINFYMSEETAKTITELSTDLAYYFLCPHCDNLEMGAAIKHECQRISWNKYEVKYDKNNASARGTMFNSMHMYNNENEYKGVPVMPQTHLSKCIYRCDGYVFTGWNTEPDGSGQSFTDGQEILNLTDVNEGVVTLYAQWEESSSNLSIDANGGTYNGKAIENITQPYNTTYTINMDSLTAPAGYTVSFNTQGGAAVSPITGTRSFQSWQLSEGFQGLLEDNIYTYKGANQCTDIIKAIWAHEAIILPAAGKEGYSFGGWYYDEACSDDQLAGKAGESIIPDRNITLYAKWVDLLLVSQDDYSVNGGKGAVDLSWSQEDGNQKSYLIYRSRNMADWSLLHNAEDITEAVEVNKSFAYTGAEQTFTAPFAGVYNISAYGSQGGAYEAYEGGKGGYVSGDVYLSEGETVTVNVGGQDGYNGGGAAIIFGNGGGATTISTDKKGSLLIAGGGGGASENGNGYVGGGNVGLVSGTAGEDGDAGGGGGAHGGAAGEYIVHSHTPLQEGETENDCYHIVNGYNITERDYYSDLHSYNTHSEALGTNIPGETSEMAVYAHTAVTGDNYTYIQLGSKTQLLPTEGATDVTIDYWAQGWGDINPEVACQTFSLVVYDQEENVLYTQTGSDGEAIYPDGVNVTISESLCFGSVTVTLPTTVTGIYIVSRIDWDGSDAWLWHTIKDVQFGDSIQLKCDYEEGEVISSKPAYGGSNYVNTEYIKNEVNQAGQGTGNGRVQITAKLIGFSEDLTMNDVPAPDLAAPNTVAAESIVKELVNTGQVKVSWDAAADNGTAYYHQARSYLTGSTNVLSHSNITRNILTSGVKGYYYLVDTNSSTSADVGNAMFTENESVDVGLTSDVQYLHISAVDVAGNVSGTIHVKLGKLDKDIAWPLKTRQIDINAVEGIHQKDDITWYVRCDGEMEFELSFDGLIDGSASEEYMINHMTFQSKLENDDYVDYSIYVPTSPMDGQELVLSGELQPSVSGNSALNSGISRSAVRTADRKELAIYQNFVLDKAANGKTLLIMPRAGADFKDGIEYSDQLHDYNNRIYLIGDSEAPEVFGTGTLENLELINRNDGSILAILESADALSGVKEFYVEVENIDNYGIQKYTPGPDGKITLDITKENSLYSGNFIIRIYAEDNVGNITELEYAAYEFALHTEISRILAPHEPVFKCGESGILTITTYGYAEKVVVEFPEELIKLNPELNKEFVYMPYPDYVAEEKIQFMIPLNTPIDDYTITVTAYKDGKEIHDYPSLCTIDIDGTVLDELKTRLR